MYRICSCQFSVSNALRGTILRINEIERLNPKPSISVNIYDKHFNSITYGLGFRGYTLHNIDGEYDIYVPRNEAEERDNIDRINEMLYR